MPTPEILGLQAWTIIEIDLGRVLRFTSGPETLTLTNDQGHVFVYEPGLDDIPARFGSNSSSNPSVTIISAPTGERSWAELLARGHLLERAKVTVRRWYVGTSLDEAFIIIVGKATNPKWGGLTEPVSFTVARRRDQAGVLPPARQVIDGSTWPVTPGFVIDPAAIGAIYPWIWGRPITGTLPAYLVEFDPTDFGNCRLHFAGHFIEAGSVEVFDEGISIGIATVEPMQDLLGVWCSTVTFSTLTVAPQLDRAYRVALNQGGGGWAVGAGEPAPWGAFDILEELLRSHGDFQIDWPRFRGESGRGNEYLIGVAVIAQTETWTIIQAILGILPVDWVQGSQGAFLKRRVMIGDNTDLAGRIDATLAIGQVDRISRLGNAGATVYNDFSIQYGLAGAQQRPQEVRYLGAQVDVSGELDLDDPRSTPSHWCRVSVGIYGFRPKPAIVTELVHDETTANLILRDLAVYHALPRADIVIRGDTTLDRFRSDDVIAVTATDISLDAEPAVIRAKVARDNSTIELQVMILEPLALRAAPV